MSRLTRLSEWLLRQPLVWGGLATMAFYALVVQQAEVGSPLERAFAGGAWHFKATTALLAFAGLASLAMRACGLVIEYSALHRRALPAALPEGQPVEDAAELLGELDAAPTAFEATYLGRRLRGALEQVRRRGSADTIEADLRTLADEDRRSLAERYANVRLLVQGTLAVGIAGAAAGVAASLATVKGQGLDAALPSILDGAGLACAGIVQALGMALVVLFARLSVEGAERRLLARVDEGAKRELVGRFVAYGTERDPHLASIQRMSERLLATVESAAERHDAEFSKSLTAATRRWEEMAGAASGLLHRSVGEALASGLKEHAHAVNGGVAKLAEQLQGTVLRHAEVLGDNIDQHTSALADALEHHAAVMTETEKRLAAESQHYLAELEASLGETMLLAATRQEKLIAQSEQLLSELQTALVDAAGTAVAHQEQLVKQSDVLLRVVDATGQVRKLEESLNSNLLSLSASHNFEQTMNSLAAAVQLLSVRLRHPAIVRNEVDLSGAETKSHAA